MPAVLPIPRFSSYSGTCGALPRAPLFFMGAPPLCPRLRNFFEKKSLKNPQKTSKNKVVSGMTGIRGNALRSENSTAKISFGSGNRIN